MATRPDGKHATKCTNCRRNTWRKSGLCKRCEMEGRFDAGKFSEFQLLRCAEELIRRHAVRMETLSKLGAILRQAGPGPGEERAA